MITRLSFDELVFRIKDSVRRLLLKYCNHSTVLNMDPIIEMARLNKKEIGDVPFPFNKFDIRIWSNDHNPPHFHVVSEGWDISFLINNGEEYRVNKRTTDSKPYSYIKKNVKPWLSMKSSVNNKLTNKEVAELIWGSEHELD